MKENAKEEVESSQGEGNNASDKVGDELRAMVEREERKTQIEKMAGRLDLPVEQLGKIGFGRYSQVVAERKRREKADEILSEQIADLLKQMMGSKDPSREFVKFMGSDILSTDLQDAFYRRTNTPDKDGKMRPVEVSKGKQLRLSSMSRYNSKGGEPADWTLEETPYNPEKESKVESF